MQSIDEPVEEASEPLAAEETYSPGSEADFERLYRNTYRRILGTLITLVRDQATAEDCAQETYERAFRHWKEWRPEASVEAWLHRIAINVAISDRRRWRLRQAGELIRRLGRPVETADPAEVAQRSDLVKAMKKLPTKQAAALVLRHYHGYSNREIAAALGVPEQTVASRLGAARKQLQAVRGRPAE